MATDGECSTCGFPVDPAGGGVCPKCGEAVRAGSGRGVLEVDVVHAGETLDIAEHKIERAVDEALRWGHAGVKVIHGHGSSTGRAVIAPRARALMRGLAARTGGRFTRDKQNPGASLIWFNKG